VTGQPSASKSRLAVVFINVERQIAECLERAKAELSRRSVELEDMTLEWRQFDETMAEFERWVGVVEDDCQSHASRAADAVTVGDVSQLIADNHVSLLYTHSQLPVTVSVICVSSVLVAPSKTFTAASFLCISIFRYTYPSDQHI